MIKNFKTNQKLIDSFIFTKQAIGIHGTKISGQNIVKIKWTE